METITTTKKIIKVVVLAILVLFTSCKDRCVKGNGEIANEMRSVSNFTSIEVSSALKVIFTQSDEYKVEVVADDNLIGYITTEVNGNELHVKVKNEKCFKKITKAEIHVSAPSISTIEISGASSFETTNQLNADNIQLKLSGASQLNFTIQTHNLNADISGASSVEVSGVANSIILKESGASEFRSTNLLTKTAVVDFSGASSGSINVQNNLNATLSGASSLNYYGNPTVSSNLSGASSINKK